MKSHVSVAASKLDKEKSIAKTFLTLFSIIVLSGIIPHLFTSYSSNIWHWNTLGHTFLGLIIIVLLVSFVTRHISRTLGKRRPFLLVSGVIFTLASLLLWLGGTYIAIFGQTEKLRWIFDSHILLGYIVLLLLLTHIASHLTKSKKKPKTEPTFNTIDSSTSRKLFLAPLFYTGILLTTSLTYSSFYNPVISTEAAIQPYDYSYGEHPFRPAQSETSTGSFINPKVIGNSPKCATCHEEIFNEWLSSLHSQAASDIAYVKNISLLEKTRGIAATRYCEGCHAPVALLSGELSDGGKHGGVPNTLANHEGVGCMGCHGITRATHLKGSASFEFTPSQTYLFEHSDNVIAQKIHNFLIKVSPRQHRTVMSPEISRSSKLCATCHEQFMDKSMNNWGWVKMQNEYSSWVSSSFSGQTEHDFHNSETMRCQDCHFPLVKGNDPSADAHSMVRSHRTPGANTAIPWLNGDKEQFETTKRFLQTSKVQIHIETPSRPDTTQSMQFIDEKLRKEQDNPFFLYLGERAKLRVTVNNRMVGHNFPAGTTDINQAWVYFKVIDAENNTIFESGALNEDGTLDKSAHKYHTIAIDRHGKEVWKHDLFRMTGDAYKNIIPAGKSDIAEYSFEVPFWAKGPLTLTTMLKYRKFNQRYASWALDDERPQLPIVVMDRDSLTVAVRNKSKVTNR